MRTIQADIQGLIFSTLNKEAEQGSILPNDSIFLGFWIILDYIEIKPRYYT